MELFQNIESAFYYNNSQSNAFMNILKRIIKSKALFFRNTGRWSWWFWNSRRFIWCYWWHARTGWWGQNWRRYQRYLWTSSPDLTWVIIINYYSGSIITSPMDTDLYLSWKWWLLSNLQHTLIDHSTPHHLKVQIPCSLSVRFLKFSGFLTYIGKYFW